jgi:hypothetical protein
MDKQFCACGCGGEVTIWKNGRSSPFLRGHHMRKQGYTPQPTGPHYCKCGCGKEVTVWVNGRHSQYIKGHHLKGTRLSLEYRIERTRNRWKREPTLSPYLKDTFVSYNKKMKRWAACTKWLDGKHSGIMHANAVYQEHFGEIPKGYVVHHKNGKHHSLHDDRPENLMLLPDEWNLRFFPVLAKGFGVEEEIVTNCYLTVMNEKIDEKEMFAKLCATLIKYKKEV